MDEYKIAVSHLKDYMNSLQNEIDELKKDVNFKPMIDKEIIDWLTKMSNETFGYYRARDIRNASKLLDVLNGKDSTIENR